MIFYKFTLLFLVFIFCLVSNSFTQPNIYVDPPNHVVYGQKTVTVDFRIVNALNIRTYAVLIKFNNSVIKFKSAIKGTFLNNNSSYSTFFATQPSGTFITDTVSVAESILGAGIGVSGSGLLFSIQFDILSVGQSPITIKSITLYDINNNPIRSTFNSGYVTVSGKVLVVDDDITKVNRKSTLGSSANLFTSSLTTAGYFVDQVNFNSLDTNTFSNYDIILLSAGVKESEIFNDANKRAALINYTLAGGKTLVEGGDVGYIFRKEDAFDSDPIFRRNNLLDSSWVSDRISTNLQITNTSHPIFRIPNNISSPTALTVNNGGLTGSGARDEMTLLSKTGISRVANWAGGIASNGGIIIYNTNGDTAKCRNIFFTFSIAQFADQSLAGKLIVNAVRYLMRDVEPPVKMLNLKALIEGFYNNSVMIPDTVNVELRGAVPPFNLIEDKKVKLDTLGTATILFTSAKDGNTYYVVIKHRNSIETWSAIGKTFSSGFLSCDFTISQNSAYGNNLIQKGTKWCIYSGDVNQDGIIDLSDLSLTDVDNLNFISGYTTTDVNGDNLVDLSDLALVDNNNLKFISRIIPTSFYK